MTTHEVTLAIYDLSNGLARQLSPSLLGTPIDGIWHTAIRAYGLEYYFGGGICADTPGATPYGTPHSLHPLGTTARPAEAFHAFLRDELAGQFSMSSYHLLDNNCNHFSDRCAMFLTDCHIPRYILDLPATAMASPLGPMLRPMVDAMQSAIIAQSAGHNLDAALGNNAITNRHSSTVTNVESSATSATSPSTATSNAMGKKGTINARAGQTGEVLGGQGKRRLTAKVTESSVRLLRGNSAGIASKLRETAGDDIPTAIKTQTDVKTMIEYARTCTPRSNAFPALDLLRLSVAQKPNVSLEVCKEALPGLLSRHGVRDGEGMGGGVDAAFLMVVRLAVNVCAEKGDALFLLRAREGEEGNEDCMYDTVTAALHAGRGDAKLGGATCKAGGALYRNLCRAVALHEDVRTALSAQGQDEDDHVEEAAMRLLFIGHEFVSGVTTINGDSESEGTGRGGEAGVALGVAVAAVVEGLAAVAEAVGESACGALDAFGMETEGVRRWVDSVSDGGNVEVRRDVREATTLLDAVRDAMPQMTQTV